MERKVKDFKQLGQMLGITEYTLYGLEMLSNSGRKGYKILRVEGPEGNIPVKEFLARARLKPEQIGFEFIGTRGNVISNKIRIVKVKLKQQEEDQK